ncbi:hypothetical protein AN403_5866 [Pseudomonas fluorescens]|uniref:Uncharacterized protein n=1 Tax=Pseudomonas fluorescens TaxID=294 RepID=A0A0P8ZW49_PSEFL|nr:hypothetical protein [Pseudomonas fluorescens]KPU61779.1 hypothetical protein AN403_5866 [Pseudomonas fluorescens]
MRSRDLFGELMQGVEEMAAQRERRFAKGIDSVVGTPIPDLETNELLVQQTMVHTPPADNR